MLNYNISLELEEIFLFHPCITMNSKQNLLKKNETEKKKCFWNSIVVKKLNFNILSFCSWYRYQLFLTNLMLWKTNIYKSSTKIVSWIFNSSAGERTWDQIWKLILKREVVKIAITVRKHLRFLIRRWLNKNVQILERLDLRRQV